jgi:hypothetical protein
MIESLAEMFQLELVIPRWSNGLNQYQSFERFLGSFVGTSDLPLFAIDCLRDVRFVHARNKDGRVRHANPRLDYRGQKRRYL